MGDTGLAGLLNSSASLTKTWPDAHREAAMLIQILRISDPSLADAMHIGLISLLTPTNGQARTHVALGHKRAVLTAEARDRKGDAIDSPHNRPQEVEWLEVLDIAVAGLSATRTTG